MIFPDYVRTNTILQARARSESLPYFLHLIIFDSRFFLDKIKEVNEYGIICMNSVKKSEQKSAKNIRIRFDTAKGIECDLILEKKSKIYSYKAS